MPRIIPWSAVLGVSLVTMAGVPSPHSLAIAGTLDQTKPLVATKPPHGATPQGVSAADRLVEAISSLADNGSVDANNFAGIVQTEKGLEFYTTDASVQQPFLSLAKSNAGDSTTAVTVTKVTNSRKALLATQDRITADLNSLRSEGIELGSWGPDYTKNRVVVAVSSSNVDAAVKVLQARYGASMVSVVAGAKWTQASKSGDSTPWWGGDWINGTARACTSGFNWISNDLLSTYISTAAHCGFSRTWFNGSNNLGSTTQLALDQRTDAQLIQNQNVAGYIYTTFGTAQPVPFYYTRQAADSHYNVCASGRNFDEECLSRVFLTNQCLQYTDMIVVVCGEIVAQHIVASSVRGGDSGGPVYTYNGIRGVTARGIINGFYSQNPTLWAYTPIDRIQLALSGQPLAG